MQLQLRMTRYLTIRFLIYFSIGVGERLLKNQNCKWHKDIRPSVSTFANSDQPSLGKAIDGSFFRELLKNWVEEEGYFPFSD